MGGGEGEKEGPKQGDLNQIEGILHSRDIGKQAASFGYPSCDLDRGGSILSSDF